MKQLELYHLFQCHAPLTFILSLLYYFICVFRLRGHFYAYSCFYFDTDDLKILNILYVWYIPVLLIARNQFDSAHIGSYLNNTLILFPSGPISSWIMQLCPSLSSLMLLFVKLNMENWLWLYTASIFNELSTVWAAGREAVNLRSKKWIP